MKYKHYDFKLSLTNLAKEEKLISHRQQEHKERTLNSDNLNASDIVV